MNGPTKLRDGTVISANIPTRDRESFFNVQSLRDANTYKAIILETFYTDSDDNKSKQWVEYKIRIVDGDKAGYEYEGARFLDAFGDPVNFGEVVFQSKTNRVKGFGVGFSNEADPPADYDNAFVMVTFLGGYRIPVILGAWSHPTRAFVGAKEDDGVRLVKEFNGIRWNINADGELIITYMGGPRTPPPQPIPGLFPQAADPSTAPTQIKIDKTGGVRVIDNELNELRISREDGTISLTQYLGSLLPELPTDYQDGYEAEPLDVNFPINEITLDKEGKSISLINYQPGGVENLSVKIDGDGGTITLEDAITQAKATIGSTKVEIETGSGTKLSVDGASDEITAEAVIGDKVTVSGPNGILAKSSTGATLKLAQAKVGLGGPGAELLDLFDQLLQQMDTLLTQMATETHIGNLGYPTAPPTNASAYAAVQAQIAVIKTMLGLIKGGI